MVSKDPHTETLRQRSCTSGPTEDANAEILYKLSYGILIQVVSKDTEIQLQMSCECTFVSRRCTLTHTVWGLLPFLIELGRRTRPATSAGDACTYRGDKESLEETSLVTDSRKEM